MADYRDLLRRAIEALPENNGNARRQVYDKARAALRKQLDAIQPELPSREKTHHRLQLEECIREVEQEATERILSGLSQLDHEDFAPRKLDLPEEADEAEEAAEPEPEPEPVVAEDDMVEPEPEPEAEEPVFEAEPEPEEPEEFEPVAEAVAPEPEPEHQPVEPEPELAAEPESEPEPDSPAPDADQAPETDSVEEPDETPVVEHVAPDVMAAEAAIGSAAVEAPKANPIWSRFRTKPSGAASAAASTGTIAAATAAAPAPAIATNTVLAAEPAMSAEREVEVDADPQTAIDHAIAVLDREASGGAMSDATIETTDPDMADLGFARAEAEEEGGGSPALTIFLLLVLLLLAGAGGAAYWGWREGFLDRNLFGANPETSVSDTAMSTDSTPAAAPAEPVRQIESTTPPETDIATDEASGPGNTASMPDIVETPATGLQPGEGGTETDLPADALSLAPTENTTTPTMDAGDETAEPATTATPEAAPTESPAADATETVAAAEAPAVPAPDAAAAEVDQPVVAEPEATEDKTDERLPVADAAGDAQADTAGTAAATPEVVAEGSQSLLLEASDQAGAGAVPFSGTVEWTRGVDELGQPTLSATANIPARNMSVDLLLRKNSDASLPASHLIEIDFKVSDSFIGGGIARIAGILMKNEELVQGVPLVGASARVVGNTFLFALSASSQDVATNTDLLQSRKWMDLAIIYSTGRQAILTLEKDAATVALFDEVMSAWNPAPAADATQ